MGADRIMSQLLDYLPLLVAAVVLLALQRSTLWRPLMARLDAIANRRGLTIALVAGVALLHYAGLALVRWPLPIHADEFSYLLMADTFTDGRLTNPTPPLSYLLWAPDVIFEPTYQSKYPPAQGVVLALGEWLGGHPLVGVWLSMAAACAATCWLMQRWLLPRWALLGGLLVASHKALAAFWGATYFGGAVAMLGGALLYGALPRLLDRPRVSQALVMATGLALLANSRPFEGLVASLPAAVVTITWLLRRRAWSSRALIRRVVLPAAGVLIAAGVSMGVYHRAVTGDPFKMPYQVFLETSNVANFALPGDSEAQSADESPVLVERHFKFYTLGGDPHLWLPLLLLPLAVRRSRWMQLALVTIVLTFTAVWFTVLASPHYAAPVTALLVALYFQCVRHLRVLLRRWRLPFQLFVAVFLTLWGTQLVDSPRLHADRISPSDRHYFSLIRAELMKPLEADDERHLIVVPWDNEAWHLDTWVKNPADIEAAKIVWAWQGVGLAEHFGGRRYWLLDETVSPPVLVETSREALIWVLRVREDTRAVLLQEGIGDAEVRVAIDEAGADAASIQLARGHPPLQKGVRYSLSFRARSDRERKVGVRVRRGDGGPIDDPELAWEIVVGPAWKDYELSYAANGDLEHAGLELWLGASTAAVEVAQLEIRVEASP